MPPKAAAKKAPAKVPANVAIIKKQLEARRLAEEKAKKEAEEEERRLLEEEKLAEQQRKFEEEQKKIEREQQKLQERREKKGKKKGPSEDVLERMRAAGMIVPGMEGDESAAPSAAKPKQPKAKPAARPATPSPEPADDRDDWEIEAEAMEREEQAQREAAEAKAAAEEEAAKEKENAEDELRSPICCVLGHVDTGKTSLLDRIRSTDVQGGEAGGITQQIGATFFPKESLTSATQKLNERYHFEINVPGLLVIDTPGHEFFTNLRSRGSSICDIAVLVVDIMHGLEQQTKESIKLLKKQKCPFVVALNKVDRLFDWKAEENEDFETAFNRQKPFVRDEFESRFATIRTEFAEQAINCELFHRNESPKTVVSVIPTSARTGEGIPDLLLFIMELVQRFMASKVTLKDVFECTALEVKPVEGFGTTIDAILVNGVLHEGDNIVVSGVNGPFKTQIRALLTPQPLRELRVKSAYVHHKKVRAAMGIKIAANELENAIPGTSLQVLHKDEDFDKLASMVHGEVNKLLSAVNHSTAGVAVQSSTIGSLEALLAFLEDRKIPVSSVSLGPIHKKHIHHTIAMKRKNPRYGVILAFDVPITPEALDLAEQNNIKIFSARIIYHLFDAFTRYNEEYEAEEKRKLREVAVFPVILKISEVIHKCDPIILGVHVLRGNLHLNTPLCIMKQGRPFFVGKVVGIQKDGKDIPLGKRTHDYAVKIVNPSDAGVSYGRHFDDQHELLSLISRASIDAVKRFPEELDQDSINLLRDLKKLQGTN